MRKNRTITFAKEFQITNVVTRPLWKCATALTQCGLHLVTASREAGCEKEKMGVTLQWLHLTGTTSARQSRTIKTLISYGDCMCP